jgi:hypothetical protein
MIVSISASRSSDTPSAQAGRASAMLIARTANRSRDAMRQITARAFLADATFRHRGPARQITFVP